ncbi:MAG TPA: histidine--tRNA ligase, partial [Longimicrobiales bacterium]
RETARRYGFEEYDGPPLESLDLYTAKSGDEIVNQLYNFTDKGGRNVSLRPEMTPTLARMAGARAGALRKPVRWFSIPQLFRYERTQRGRLREHFQWNVDILGEEDISADAEVVAVALDSLRSLGLTSSDVVARFNDRRLLERLVLGAGVQPEKLGAAYAAIDKLTREPAERIRAKLVENAAVTDAVADRVMQIFTHHDLESLRTAYASEGGVILELDRLRAYEAHLAALGFKDYVQFDAAIVRGLAYYTGTVFEIFDRAGELRAICGGGRYDDLLGAVSGTRLPGVGFGMGDVVLGELLADRGLLPPTTQSVDYYLVWVGGDERAVTLRLAQALRARGSSVLYGLRSAGVGKQFKDADARGARRVIVIGADEVKSGEVLIREMATGSEERASLAALMAADTDEAN